MPMKYLGIVLCNVITLLFLFHAAGGTEYEQDTGGWSAVVRVRQQCLRQGLSVMALLSAEWWQLQNEAPLPPGDPVLGEEQKVLMTTSLSTKAPFPTLRQVPSAVRQTPLPPSPAFSTPFSLIRCQVLPFNSWELCVQDTLLFLPKDYSGNELNI